MPWRGPWPSLPVSCVLWGGTAEEMLTGNLMVSLINSTRGVTDSGLKESREVEIISQRIEVVVEGALISCLFLSGISLFHSFN